MTKKLKGRGVEEAVLLPTPKLITAILQNKHNMNVVTLLRNCTELLFASNAEIEV